MNNCVLIGRFVKETELKYAAGSGTAVLRGILAVDRKVAKDKEKTADFISILAFGKTAESIANYCGAKGDQIGIAGRLQSGKYDDKNGVTHYTTEVVVEETQFLNPKKSNNTSDAEQHFKDNGVEMTYEDGDSPF